MEILHLNWWPSNIINTYLGMYVWPSDVCVANSEHIKGRDHRTSSGNLWAEGRYTILISDWVLISIIHLITGLLLAVLLYPRTIVLECVHGTSLIGGALGLIRQWTDGLALPVGSVGQDGWRPERQNWMEWVEKCRTEVIADKWTFNRPSTSPS